MRLLLLLLTSSLDCCRVFLQICSVLLCLRRFSGFLIRASLGGLGLLLGTLFLVGGLCGGISRSLLFGCSLFFSVASGLRNLFFSIASGLCSFGFRRSS